MHSHRAAVLAAMSPVAGAGRRDTTRTAHADAGRPRTIGVPDRVRTPFDKNPATHFMDCLPS